MRKSWLVCVLVGSATWGQAQMAMPAGAPKKAAATAASEVPAEAAVLTITAPCPAPATAGSGKAGAGKAAAAKTSPATCKTVVTRAEFEKMASAVAPNNSPQVKQRLAAMYPQLLVLSQVAKARGMEKSAQFEQTLKFARMQILSTELQKSIQEEAARVPEQEIADYYKKNPEAYSQYSVLRLYVPKVRPDPPADAKDDKAATEDKAGKEPAKTEPEVEKARQEKSEDEMTKLAESLRARAAAGEDFVQLQKEAYLAANMNIDPPSPAMPPMRRIGLPPAHAAVFDLKAGEVSQVISDTGGHYVYKLVSEEEVPLEKVKDEIHGTLQSQRTRDMMDKLKNSYSTVTNEAYFGPPAPTSGPGGTPPRMPRSAMPPEPPAQQAPAPQTPAAKPN